MGNANTEKKKLKRAQIQAREFLKTRAWREFFSDLTPLDQAETLLLLRLVREYCRGQPWRRIYTYNTQYAINLTKLEEYRRQYNAKPVP